MLSKLIAIIKGEKGEKDNTYAELSEDDDLTRISISYNARKKIVDTFEIKGRGWGHAVGMSQNGAKGMASNGFTCEEIIKWYYKGVEVE